MKKTILLKTIILSLFGLFFTISSINAQVQITQNTIGINTIGPLSSIGINGPGLSTTGLHVTDIGITTPLINGLVSDLTKPTTSAWKYSVNGIIESGTGNAVGIRGVSITDNASTEGRSYGVYGTASNATSGYNYGVFGELRGVNGGTAVLGWDRINNPNWALNTNGYWAGYFVGKTCFTDTLNISGGGVQFPDGTVQITANNGGGSGLWTASGNDIYNNNSANVGIGINTPLHKLHVADNLTTSNVTATKIDYTPNAPSTATYGIHVEGAALTDKGQTHGVFAQTSSSYSSQSGETVGILGLSKAYDGNGAFFGVSGRVKATQLTNIDNFYSRTVGGNFYAEGDNLTLGSGNFWVAGMHATLNGVINNTPTSGAVAAVIGVDSSQGTAQSWAGYFVGKGHFSDKVTIGTTQMPATIGATNYSLADYKLFVCGGILANEWLVPNVTWCDYVFEKDYELTSLPAVEQQIKDKGHLHNTPSAAEIEGSGLKMAEITINQQEKIEEIFLHLIKLNKEVTTLRAENAALKALIK